MRYVWAGGASSVCRAFHDTIVQPDFEMMRPIGMTNHYSRIFTPNAQAVSNETFMAGTQVIGRNCSMRCAAS